MPGPSVFQLKKDAWLVNDPHLLWGYKVKVYVPVTFNAHILVITWLHLNQFILNTYIAHYLYYLVN